MAKNTPDPIPPDVAAYLIDAAVEMAADYGFSPSSEEEMRQWLEVHHQDIGKRASDAMWRLFNSLMQSKEMMDMAADHIGEQVYTLINANPNKQTYVNPKFVEYCEVMGYANYEEWKKRDKGSAASFICWCHANPRKQS